MFSRLKSKLTKTASTRTLAIAADTSGNTAMMFALALLPMMMLGGVAIDMKRAANGKAMAQDAVDAAVLLGARTYLDNGTLETSERQTKAINAAKASFNTSLAQAERGTTKDSVNFVFADDYTLTATAEVRTKTIFSAIVGKETILSSVQSEAQAGDVRGFEIVLVLDNTTSMFDDDRMDKMRTSAKQFVETMFVSSPDPSKTRIGVVPTAALININVEAPRAWNTAVDAGATAGANPPAAGSRSIPNTPFENRVKYLRHYENGNTVTASEVSDMYQPVEWRGCIKAANNERKVNSSGVVIESLTDAAVPGMKWPVALVEPERRANWVVQGTPPPPPGTGDNTNSDNTTVTSPPPPPPAGPPPPPPPPPPPGVQGSLDYLVPDYGKRLQRDNIQKVRASDDDYWTGWVVQCEQSSDQNGFDGARNVYGNLTEDCTDNYTSKKTGTIQACVSDPNEFEYISDGNDFCTWQDNVMPWDEAKPISGPNLNCPTAMLGMSSSPVQVFEKLDHMYPVPGGTQTDVGMMWALRMLSPRSEWTEFFGYAGGQEPEAFNQTTTRKMVILLTDGENRPPYHFEGYYGCLEGDTRGGNADGCWQYDDVEDLSGASLDALLLDSCEAMRDDYGVEVYTIAVDVNDTDAQATLTDCAGTASSSYNVASDQLDNVFSGLAKRTLRLTK